MNEKRRFSRITFIEKSFIEAGGITVEVNLLDISLKGALIEVGDNVAIQKGDTLQLTFHLGKAEIILQFEAEVIHRDETKAGLKFIKTDLDTMIHLRSLIEARTMDPDKVRDELGFLIEEGR
jgi:hypothetical protein